MDERPMRFAIAGGVILLFGIFYWTRQLFEAYNFNDFGEYYLRAQDWVNGRWINSGGSDILLSVVEYLAIRVHPYDFLASYRLTAQLLILILMGACFLFVVRRNALLPDYWTKLSTIVLALSIPHFIFATVTVDQSLLFAACLLFFLSTYNLRWAGPVALIAFISRPEAAIILPLYVLLFAIDRKKRKDIAINFGTFLLLLLALRFWPGSAEGTSRAATDYQEYGFLDKLGWDYFTGLLRHILNFPVVMVTYAYEMLQSTFLWVFFMLGLVLSVRQRQAWAMYGVLFSFLLAYAVFFADAAALSYSQLFSIIEQMRAESDYFMVKAFHKFDSLMGHGRYRLVLYPALAFFVVQGVVHAVQWPMRLLSKKALPRLVPVAIAVLVAGFALYHSAVRLRPIAREYNTERKLSRMHPVYKMGLELRKQAGHGAVLIDNFCDETDGSFLMVFSTFSGRDTVLTRFCKYGVWIRGEGGNQLVNYKDYESAMPHNPYLLAKYYRSVTLASEMHDSTRVRAWETLFTYYPDSLLAAENISHVLAAEKINAPSLQIVDSLDKGGYMHRYTQDSKGSK
jgi:hypothetical protein